MLVSKNHLLVAPIASKDDTRPVLTGVKVYNEDGNVVSVATDGFMLGEVIEKTLSTEDYPKLLDERTPVEVDEVLIPAKTATRVAGAIVKNSAMPVLRYALLEGDRISTTDLEEITSLGFRAIEGNYPDYRQLMPKEDNPDNVVVHLDPKLLVKALKMFNGDHVVKLIVQKGRLTPVLLTAEIETGKKTAVIMPLKS